MIVTWRQRAIYQWVTTLAQRHCHIWRQIVRNCFQYKLFIVRFSILCLSVVVVCHYVFLFITCFGSCLKRQNIFKNYNSSKTTGKIFYFQRAFTSVRCIRVLNIKVLLILQRVCSHKQYNFIFFTTRWDCLCL